MADLHPGDGNARVLRNYWVRGIGALKIRWFVKGDYLRCVAELTPYVRDPKGLCNSYHKDATGFPPGKGPHIG